MGHGTWMCDVRTCDTISVRVWTRQSNLVVHGNFFFTVKQFFYCILKMSRKLWKRVIHVKLKIKNNWTLLHDYTLCHTATSIRQVLSNKNIPIVSYSPHLSSCEFFLFHRLKNYLKQLNFWLLENIKKAVTDQLMAILVFEFHRC